MEKPKAGGDAWKKTADAWKNPRVRIGVGVAGLVVVGLIVLLASGGGGGGNGNAGEPEAGSAEVVSADALREAVSGAETPVYWAGEQQSTELELSQPGEGRTFVRYLTGGAKAGDKRPNFLTIGTYAQANPVSALKHQGAQPGGVLGTAPGNATVYFNRNEPHSVYLAYPGVEVEIEVYDPDFTHALQLVNSGQIIAAG